MVITIVFLLVSHQSFDRFSYLWAKLDHFLLLKMEVYFYSYFIVFFFSFLSGLIKMIMTTITFCFYFLHFGCCSFSFLASSICLCHNALFISNLHNKKKVKSDHVCDVCLFRGIHFASFVLPFIFKKDMIIVLLEIPQHPYLTVTYTVFVLKKVTFESYIYI